MTEDNFMKTPLFLAALAAVATPAGVAAQETDSKLMLDPVEPISDADIEQFAGLILQAQGIQNSEAIADEDKERVLIDTIRESDMGIVRFTQVSEMVGEDEALQQRIQQAVIAQLAAASR